MYMPQVSGDSAASPAQAASTNLPGGYNYGGNSPDALTARAAQEQQSRAAQQQSITSQSTQAAPQSTDASAGGSFSSTGPAPAPGESSL